MKDFSTENIPYLKLACPYCGAKNPKWAYHDSYERYLIGFENQASVTYIINITRIICSSCEHPHAVLPEIIIPHNSYSLSFVITVLKDYFNKVKTSIICKKYQISISQLYRWRKLFLEHKKLWLGILNDLYHSPLQFISSFISSKTSEDLCNFFKNLKHSFLQGTRKKANWDTS